MLNSLVAIIDSLLDFASEHSGDLLHPSSLLTDDQLAELTKLDIDFYAHCQGSGLSFPVLPGLAIDGLRSFGNSRLPYLWGTIHLPVQEEADNRIRETVASGMLIVPTPAWYHAMQSVRAGAVALTGKPGATEESRKRKRGRPAGGKTQARDRPLYLDWKAANRRTGITKAEFLRERGLPASDLAAIERGRKQAEEKNPPGKKTVKSS
jgi:hypothetical protein